MQDKARTGVVRCGVMGLPFDLETRVEQELPLRLQESLDVYRPQCRECGLMMQRHHRYSQSTTTHCGVLELQIPVFRCGDCHNMTSGSEPLGDGETNRRYSKNQRVRGKAGLIGTELHPGRTNGGKR